MIRPLVILLATTVTACAYESQAPIWPGTPEFKPLGSTEKPRKPQVRGWLRHTPSRTIIKRDVVMKVEGLDEPGSCRPSVSVVGDEARSKEAAELQARQHFMKTVRFHWGEKFIEIGNARDVFFQCNRSDFPISGGKVGAAIDAVSHSWRCSIKATPCAQSIVREEK